MKLPEKNIFVVGLNHETAPLEVRERVVFDASSLANSYAELKDKVGVDETLILSTCNRTEIYVACDDFAPVSNWVAETKGLSLQLLETHLYVKTSEEVLAHAAAVASGINSMVIGETQISGQMKVAYQYADASNCLGGTLRKIFDTAFSIAKEIRSNTDIGAHSVSMASSSLRAAERIFPDLEERSVVFIGAGEMINLFAQHFKTKGVRSLSFCNRTIAHAEKLAKRFTGEVVEIGNLADNLSSFDIVVSCTSSPIPILGRGAFDESLRRRRHKPMVVFDLAVPRDVEVSVSTLDDVFLFTVDDLGEMVRKSVSIRKSALEDAERIISERVCDFSSRLEGDGSIRLLKAFRNFGAEIVRTEREKAIAALGRGENPEEVLRRLSNSLGQKFLDRPSRVLNNVKGEKRAELSDSLVKLFELDGSV